MAKQSFQLHGATPNETVLFRGKLTKRKLHSLLDLRRRCTVAVEACTGFHDLGRRMLELGHEVRLAPPIYVRPFVKRNKNHATDAEALCEVAQRPTLRFVAVKTAAA